MALINRVKQMQQQGYNQSQIIQQLQEEGNQPLDIKNAIEQANIKQAVNQPQGQSGQQTQPQQGQAGEYAVPNYLTSRRFNLKLKMKF